MVLNPRTMWMFLISWLLSVFTGSLTHSWPAYDHGSASVTLLTGVDCGGFVPNHGLYVRRKTFWCFFHSLTIKLGKCDGLCEMCLCLTFSG